MSENVVGHQPFTSGGCSSRFHTNVCSQLEQLARLAVIRYSIIFFGLGHLNQASNVFLEVGADRELSPLKLGLLRLGSGGWRRAVRGRT